MKKLTIIMLLCLTFVGCKRVEFQDGRIPTEYLPSVQKLVGTYEGAFNGVPGRLLLGLSGDRPFVLYFNQNSNDLLGSQCESHVQQILWAEVSGQDEDIKIKSIGFQFNPNNCFEVEGREFTLSLQKGDDDKFEIAASLLYKKKLERSCHWENFPPYGSHEVCDVIEYPHVFEGTFHQL